MKKITTVLFLCLSVLIGYAQSNEGYVKMELTDIVTDNDEIKAQMNMMKGSTQELFFNKEQALMKMNMMGGMMEIAVLSNLQDKSGVMLYSMMGSKYKIPFTPEDSEKMEKESANNGLKFTYDESDKKTIAGYECYRVDITNEENEDFKLTAYITEDISSSASMLQGISGDKMKGFPLEYTMDAGGQFTMVYTAQEVKKEVDAKAFEVNQRGYTKMTMEEFQETMGQMGGMGGF